MQGFSVGQQLDIARDASIQALLSGEWSTARRHANVALLIVSTIPDGTLAGLSTQTWSRTGIVAFLAQLDRLEAAADTSESGGMIIQDYSYGGERC